MSNLAAWKADNPHLITLSDLYDADRRSTDPAVRTLAGKNTIPHPLPSVQYADGIYRCTHAKRHGPYGNCPLARWRANA